jgi:hypothetical protein
MKQSAVEWLKEQIEKNALIKPYRELGFSMLLEQAKEMEKQQIIDAHGNKEKKSGGVSNATYILTGEEYYNETFKK